MDDKVSIIIPVYGAEKSLKRCVESLCAGTYSNIEILLIDDCSPDNSLAVCKQLQETYTQVKVLCNEQNMGVSETRNRGLAEMTGTYLMFVDSDDWVEPDYVETFVNAYQQFGADMTVCGYINHDEVQNNATDYFGWKDVQGMELRPLRSSLNDLLQERLLQQIWNKFFLASIIKDNALRFDPSIKMGEDFRFLLAYLGCVIGDKLLLINKPLYHYIRCSGTSAMSNFGTEKIDEPLKNYASMYRLMGLTEEEIQVRLEKDKDDLTKSYAYLIMHNMGMRAGEKKKLIYALSETQGKELYRKNKSLYSKERIMIWLKKLGLKR